MEGKKFYRVEEMEDKQMGEKGSGKGDGQEEEVKCFLIGEGIKEGGE